jgi:hypothetical protein
MNSGRIGFWSSATGLGKRAAAESETTAQKHPRPGEIILDRLLPVVGARMGNEVLKQLGQWRSGCRSKLAGGILVFHLLQ